MNAWYLYAISNIVQKDGTALRYSGDNTNGGWYCGGSLRPIVVNYSNRNAERKYIQQNKEQNTHYELSKRLGSSERKFSSFLRYFTETIIFPGLSNTGPFSSVIVVIYHKNSESPTKPTAAASARREVHQIPIPTQPTSFTLTEFLFDCHNLDATVNRCFYCKNRNEVEGHELHPIEQQISHAMEVTVQ